ncbi:hypothetical protein BDW69DRAFT_180944 [Aspergillus filifer]
MHSPPSNLPNIPIPTQKDNKKEKDKVEHDIICWDSRPVQGNTKALEKGKNYLKEIARGGLNVLDLTNQVEITPDDWLAKRYKWVSAGPSSCEELFCEQATGIWFCNDDPEKHRWMEMEHIIESIEVIRKECVMKDGYFIAGELNHADLWRLKVKQPYSYVGSGCWDECATTWPAIGGLGHYEKGKEVECAEGTVVGA